jgi:hypothetical protein
MRPFLLFVSQLIVPNMASAQRHVTRTDPPGPYPVGLRVVEQYDLSRDYLSATDPYTGKATRGTRARPIQTLIWYPDETGSGVAMNARN